VIDAELQRDAEELLRRFAAARSGGPTFGALLDEFLKLREKGPSIAAYRSRARPLREFFGPTTAAAMTIASGAEYRSKRLAGGLGKTDEDKPVGQRTVEHELAMAKAVLNWAVDSGKVSSNPLGRLKRTKLKRNPQASLREEHLPAVIQAAPDLMTAVYVIVAFDTGCRRSEALWLQWDDVDARALAIIVRHGKGDKERTVLTTSRAIDAIRRMPRVIGNPYIFATTDRRRKGLPVCHEQINDMVREAIVASGVERFYGGRKVRIHALRRGHATNAVERGVDPRTVQEQLGHASLATTELYLDSRFDHRRREMRQKYDRDLADPLATPDLGSRLPPHRASTSEEEKQGVDELLLDRR
jgi:integrase